QGTSEDKILMQSRRRQKPTFESRSVYTEVNSNLLIMLAILAYAVCIIAQMAIIATAQSNYHTRQSNITI
ncbi:MAG: hypothetical protein ACXWM7_06790, partial [Parachlamydiaceae bacterium]